MQRIADDFAAINARLSEISAEKAKARGDEPKPAPTHELPSPYYVQSVNSVYQAPDDYCGFKSSADRFDHEIIAIRVVGQNQPVYFRGPRKRG